MATAPTANVARHPSAAERLSDLLGGDDHLRRLEAAMANALAGLVRGGEVLVRLPAAPGGRVAHPSVETRETLW